MIGPDWHRNLRFRSVPTIIGVSGIVLLLWSTLETLGLFVQGATVVFLPKYLIGYVTIVPSCLGMVWAMRWLRERETLADRYDQIGKYWFLGGVGFLVFNLGLMYFFPQGSIWEALNWIRWALTLGMAVGLAVGISQARAISGQLSAERQSLRAEHLEQQRDLIDQMNGILRHEILNATQVIAGNASLLMESDEPIDPSDPRLERIDRQADGITEVIKEVRVLLSAIEDEREFRPVNLPAKLAAEAQKLEDQYPAADIEVRCPEDVYVEADGLVGRIFGNIIGNAVKHNDTSSLAVTVEATTTDGNAVVTIADDGSGIPEGNLDSLFDRPTVGDHGLGLYLVDRLADNYDGAVELVETGEEGTTFEVRIPLTESSAERGRNGAGTRSSGATG